jgi:Arc/MetJ-type ribon-helix-helix transcriptional regulator
MTDRQGAQGTLGTLDPVDDAETPDSVSPQALEFAAQRPPKFWIVTERSERISDAAFHLGRKSANHLGRSRSDDDSIAAHLAPRACPLDPLLEHLVERLALSTGGEMTLATPDLPHQVGIAEDLDRGLEALVLVEVHQHSRRTPSAPGPCCSIGFLSGMRKHHTRRECAVGAAKVAITIEEELLKRIDRLVDQRRFPNRSRAIQEAVRDKLERLDRGRLARECAKLSKKSEQTMADEGLREDLKGWPEF